MEGVLRGHEKTSARQKLISDSHHSFKVPLESSGSSTSPLAMDRVEAMLEGQRVADSLQVFPGDVRVAGGSGSRRGATQCQDVGPQRGQPLRAELGVDQVQMCPHHQDGRVRRPRLQINHHTGEGGSQSCAAPGKQEENIWLF